MNEQPNSAAVNPATLAVKLAAVAQRQAPKAAEELEKNPRLVEALWFIQWRSMQPGGLALFAEEIIRATDDNFATDVMRSIGKTRGEIYTFEELVRVWRSFPSAVITQWGQRMKPQLARLMSNADAMNRAELRRAGMDRQLVEYFTPEALSIFCESQAEENLAEELRDVCLRPGATFTNTGSITDALRKHARMPAFWYVQDLPAVLFAMMDRHAEKTLQRIAPTASVEAVWREMRFAVASRGLVTIEGATRFGKTEAVKTWTEAHPGRMRYFAVPPPARLNELHRAVAGAFGLPYTARTSAETVKDEVNYILEYGRIGVAADESHWLVPRRQREPVRLDWFRTHIVDKGTPSVLCLTEQFEKDMAEFTRQSTYNADQWLGRIKRALKLADGVSEADLLAVARKHLPGFSDALLRRVAGRAEQNPHFLATMQNVADRARFLAVEAGRMEITADDVELAMDDCAPSALRAGKAPKPQTEATRPATAKPSRPARAPLAAAPALTNLPLGRSVTPAEMADLAATD